MHHTQTRRRARAGLTSLLAGLALWPAIGAAQLLPPIGGGGASALTGNASAVQATILGVTSTLAGTGNLAGSTDALSASQAAGNLTGLSAGTLSAATIGYPDQVDSNASLGNLQIGAPGLNLGADFVMSEASAIAGAGGSGTSTLSGLVLNGMAVPVTGAPNQVVAVPGGLLVINEQTSTAGGIVVNALHLILYGVADVALARSTAAIQ